MGQREKLVARLKSRPRDFTFEELERLLRYFGFVRSNKGRTSGSRVSFVNRDGCGMSIHMPHPGNELKAYQLNALIDMLEREGLI